MKIQRFKIENTYKNFHNLEIDFSSCKGVAAFIGDNASGKSNLLETLSAIFKNLYLDEKDEFDYFLEYNTFSNNNVKITSNKKNRIFALNGIPVYDIKEHLPKRVVAIYSGEEDRLWKNYYEPMYLDYVDSIAKNTNLEYPRMFFINKFYWNIILLSLLMSDAPDVKEFIFNKLGIKKVDNIKFKFYKTRYEKYQNNPALSLIRRLDAKENYSLEEFKRVISGDFNTSDSSSENFFVGYTPTDIFQVFYVAFTPKDLKIIDDIQITFNQNLTLSSLSEGQKKMLLIKAALEFASSEDTLVLLDEPDAHIHLGNKQEIVKVFEPYKDTRQIILTTHSPTLTHTLSDDNIFMLTKGELIKKDKQYIINELTKEYWSKQHQNLFLASNKKIILLVEGKHDLIHIENAFKHLKSDYPELDFDIFSLRGEKNIAPMLIGLRDANLNNGKIYIGLYDNDKPGQDSLNKGGYKPMEKPDFRKLLENGYAHNNYFAFMLPKPPGFSGDCTIENMYEGNKFENAFTQAVSQTRGYFQNKSIEEVTEDIKLKAKNNLSEQSATFTKEDFRHFIPLFDTIKEISFTGIPRDSNFKKRIKSSTSKNRKKEKSIGKNAPTGIKYSENIHLAKGSETAQKVYIELKEKILNLKDEITVVPLKDYIAFKKKTNIVDIAIQSKQLKLWLNLKKGQLKDSQELARDVSAIGHWGNGDYEIIVNENSNLSYIISLIKQVLKTHN